MTVKQNMLECFWSEHDVWLTNEGENRWNADEKKICLFTVTESSLFYKQTVE